MKTLAELTTRVVTPTGKASNEERAHILSSRIPLGKKTARYATYEVEVLNFLFDNKAALGIQSVIKFDNLLLDGEVVLTNGKRLVVEIKLRMNWLKQCQAMYQFSQFLNRTKEAKNNPVDGAIVFFEEFSGDWNKKASKKAKNLWGWEAWYLFSCNAIPGKRMDLVKLCKKRLQGYPD